MNEGRRTWPAAKQEQFQRQTHEEHHEREFDSFRIEHVFV